MDNNFILDIIKSTHEAVIAQKADISAIKTDLKDHMRRTAILETEVKYLHGRVFMARGALAAGAALLAVVGAAIKFWN